MPGLIGLLIKHLSILWGSSAYIFFLLKTFLAWREANLHWILPYKPHGSRCMANVALFGSHRMVHYDLRNFLQLQCWPACYLALNLTSLAFSMIKQAFGAHVLLWMTAATGLLQSNSHLISPATLTIYNETRQSDPERFCEIWDGRRILHLYLDFLQHSPRIWNLDRLRLNSLLFLQFFKKGL